VVQHAAQLEVVRASSPVALEPQAMLAVLRTPEHIPRS
jgi:hypothetical protein